MKFGTQEDTGYCLYIRDRDRITALNTIKEGLAEYIPADYFHGEDPLRFFTSELCSTDHTITFATLIPNLDALLSLSCDGRGKNKIKVIFGVEGEDPAFQNAETILETFG